MDIYIVNKEIMLICYTFWICKYLKFVYENWQWTCLMKSFNDFVNSRDNNLKSTII